jgi:ADP-ribose pyrophosphatase YjhB (NUDIX family)
MHRPLHYCPTCGASVKREIPPRDDRERYVCSRDGEVFYQNPLVVVGTIPVHGDRILLCRRSIEPRTGFWTLPAGFLELGETTVEAGVRETREEAMAEVEPGPLFALFNVAHIGQLHMFYRAVLPEPKHAPGPESAETALFEAGDIPWRQLAFPTIHRALTRFLEDRERGAFTLHTENLDRESWHGILDREPEQPIEWG